MTSRCQMYSPSTSRMFFAPKVLARPMYFLHRPTWNSRTGALKSIRPNATTGSEMIGRPSLSQVLAMRLISFCGMPTASVKMSTQSKPMRAMCSRPVAVSMPAWWKVLLMMPSFINPMLLLRPPKFFLQLAKVHFDERRPPVRTGVRHRAAAQIGDEIFQFRAGQRIVGFHGMTANRFGHRVLAETDRVHILAHGPQSVHQFKH